MGNKRLKYKCKKTKYITVFGIRRPQFIEGKYYYPTISGNKLEFRDHENRYRDYPIRYTRKHLMEFFQFQFKYGK